MFEPHSQNGTDHSSGRVKSSSEGETEHPLISVITPAYNAGPFIATAIRSVQRQTYPHLEILVVDDGSEDDTVEVVQRIASEDPRVRLFRQSNQGVAAARNRAIRASEGAFVAPLDADDVWFPEKLERQLRRMQALGPETGLVYSWWMYVNYDDEIYRTAGRPKHEGDVFESHIFQNFIGNASVPLIRRSSLERVGLYDPSLRARKAQGCEDWDLTLRIAEHYEFGLVPDHLSVYRAVSRPSDAKDARTMSDDTHAMARSHNIVLERVRQDHPEVPDEVFRWSKSMFYDYVAETAYEGRSFSLALYWLLRLVRVDPVALLSSRVWWMGGKSLVGSVGALISALIQSDLDDWNEFREWVRNPYGQIQAERERRLAAKGSVSRNELGTKWAWAEERGRAEPPEQINGRLGMRQK